MLQIHFANRLESLTTLLLARLGEDGRGDPLAAAQVIVPSAAMQRHLTLAAADAHGICANVAFTFLAQWLWQQIGRVLPEVQAESPFAPDVMAWRVYAAFGDAAFVAAHPRLAAYLAEADDVMRLDLARRSAGLLEQYITYRPQWLQAWLAHEPAPLGTAEPAARADEAWQAALWRRIAAELQLKDDPARRLIDVLEQPGGVERAREAGLPASAHVFALPAMPPMYIRLLQALGRCMALQVYVLNPCREYWFEVIDRRRLAHLAREGRDALHEEGNHLLAAWGRQTQAQIDLLVEAGGEALVDDALFVAHEAPTLLAAVQNAVLDLVELPPASLHADRSIEVHRCHSLTRQLEVLQDQLLAMFSDPALPGLQPSDVLVVTPDLDAAAPLIDAVFGTAPADRQLPFAVTGRPRSRINRCARALPELLSLLGSRLPASGLHGLLQQPVVARRFGLDADALEQVQGWLAEAGVRWAFDAQHRGSFGVPAEAHHTLDDGLARLFLGYALPAQATAPFAGRLPAGDAEGAEADTLGALWRYARALAQLQRRCSVPHTPAGWQALLQQAMDQFIHPDDDELEDLRELRQAVQSLVEAMARGGLADEGAQPLPLAVLRSALERALDDPARGGVPTGSITFSSMSSLRGLPYRVVCAIGLDDGAFPTATREAEFDLMALRPQRGDRQRRFDERNLFLDLLLAARDRLLLAYTGRSVRDNAELPPSVLVSELLDTLAPAVRQGRGALVVEHALQPFSADNFHVDTPLPRRSFHREYAQALAVQRRQPPAADTLPAAAFDLPEDDTEGEDATLLGRLQGGGGIGVLGDDVAALVDQRLGGIGFLGRIVPGRGPDHLGLEIGVHLLRGERKGVDAHHHLRDREGGDVAGRARFRHVPGDGADHGAALIEAGVVGGDVLGALIAGRVLELQLRELLRHLDRRVHEAEGGGEDQLVAGLGELADGARRVRPLGDVLDEAGLDLGAVFLFQRLAALVVRPGPAMVADRPDIDESDAEGRLGEGAPARKRQGGGSACPEGKAAAGDDRGHGLRLPGVAGVKTPRKVCQGRPVH